MKESFLTFQTFNDEAVAKDFVKLLVENNIRVETEDSSKFFDVSFAMNPMERQIRVKLLSQDFNAAHEVLKKLLPTLNRKHATRLLPFQFCRYRVARNYIKAG